MAPNLARISAPTVGEAGRLNMMKAPKAPALAPYKPPKNLGSQTPQHSTADQFMLRDPWKPGTLQGTAQTAYDADVANANKLAGMGTTPDAQIASDFAQRGQNANSVYQALQQQLAGIQTAQVAQGNAGSAALGTQNAAIGAAPGVLPTAGAQAVLGANTAATGNYGGSLQAAALSAGAQANTRALDAGTVAQQANDQSKAKVLQSLLSGVALPSARVDSMRLDNQKVDAANLATRIGVYRDDETAKTAALVAGNKQAYDAANLKEQRDEANWSNAEKVKVAKISQAGQTARTATTQAGETARAKAKARADAAKAKTTADAKVTAAATTAAGKSIGGSASGTTAGGKPVSTYYVSYKLPDTTAVDPNTGKLKVTKNSIKQKPIAASVWQKYLASGPEGKRQLKILGFPNGTKIRNSTAK